MEKITGRFVLEDTRDGRKARPITESVQTRISARRRLLRCHHARCMRLGAPLGRRGANGSYEAGNWKADVPFNHNDAVRCSRRGKGSRLSPWSPCKPFALAILFCYGWVVMAVVSRDEQKDEIPSVEMVDLGRRGGFSACRTLRPVGSGSAGGLPSIAKLP